MNELDQALQAYVQDENQQARYYELILNGDFYIPLQPVDARPSPTAPDAVRPLVLTAEGKRYMLLFDSEERLTQWAGRPTPFAILAGHAAAAVSTPELHWAVNLGSGYAKEFVPEEIRWLRERAGK